MIRSKPHRRSTGSAVGGSKKKIIYCDERIHGLYMIRLTLYYNFSLLRGRVFISGARRRRTS